jgi:hypothetical protein
VVSFTQQGNDGARDLLLNLELMVLSDLNPA